MSAHRDAAGSELERKTVELEQRLQATSDILRIISQSPNDVRPVFDAIVLASVRRLGCDMAFLLRCDATGFTPVAMATPEGLPTDLGARQPIDPGANLPSRAIIERKTQHIPDFSLVELPDYDRRVHEIYGINSALFLPLLRAGECIGLLALAGKRACMFGASEIALAESFRDQALIAIENVRLFNEVQAKTRDLSEALQQQTATADVLKVVSRSAFDLQTVLESLTQSAVELSGARRGVIFLRDGDLFRFKAASYADLHPDWIQYLNGHPQKAGRNSAIARAISSGQIVCVPDVLADPEIDMPATALAGIRAVLAVPLLRDGKVEGIMALSRQTPGPFNARQIELVQTFADQAVIAIENTRLFNETKESLERQTATAEILNVIASSPTDTQPVFDVIARSATELCEGMNSGVYLLQDGLVHVAGHHNVSPEQLALAQTAFPTPPHRGIMSGRAILDRAVAHVPDIAADPEYTAVSIVKAGFRSVIAVPMLRNGEPIGAINVTREEARPFSDRQIELLRTFADQAVIAIENVRLFNETQEALERQTATADILKVIAGSPSDVQPVFQTIAERSNRLLSGLSTAVFSIVDDVVHLSGFTATSSEADMALKARFPAPLSSFGWSELIRKGEIVRMPETEAEPESLRNLARMRGCVIEPRSA
jgi:GAF domain-containing protein